MAQEYEEQLEFTEENERGWRDYLREFVEKVYPIFKPYGFSIPEAFSAWTTNRVRCQVESLNDPPSEEWEEKG